MAKLWPTKTYTEFTFIIMRNGKLVVADKERLITGKWKTRKLKTAETKTETKRR